MVETWRNGVVTSFFSPLLTSSCRYLQVFKNLIYLQSKPLYIQISRYSPHFLLIILSEASAFKFKETSIGNREICENTRTTRCVLHEPLHVTSRSLSVSCQVGNELGHLPQHTLLLFLQGTAALPRSVQAQEEGLAWIEKDLEGCKEGKTASWPVPSSCKVGTFISCWSRRKSAAKPASGSWICCVKTIPLKSPPRPSTQVWNQH